MTLSESPGHDFEHYRPTIDEYARLAHQYESRWSRYVEATADHTLARLGSTAPEAVLDVGCGTGHLLQKIAERFPSAHLAGIDPTPEMLALAREKLPSSAELRRAFAEQLPFPADRFDVVISANVFHYLRRPDDVLREMLRVLRPGGKLIITDWCDDYLACRICDLWLRRFNPAHHRTYKSRECEAMLERAGARDITVERYKISLLWGMMTASAVKPLHNECA